MRGSDVRPSVPKMAFETTLTVPTPHLPELARRLAMAGFTVLDTGERVATEEGPEGEATVRVVHLATVELGVACDLGVSA